MPTSTRTRKASAKALDRAKLKETDIIWIGIRASEFNLQRLGAFLLFAEYPYEVESQTEPTGPMMFEDPADVPLPAEADHVDYEVVKRDIFKNLGTYLEKHGQERAREMLLAYGGARISEIPQNRLVSLAEDLQRAVGG